MVRESLRSRKFNRAVETLGATETTRDAARRRIAGTRISFGGTGFVTARIENEVGIAIVERTVFDYVAHVAIDTTNAKRDVLVYFILQTHAVFANALRLQAGIEWRGIGAEVSRAGQQAGADTGNQRGSAYT